jgi:hypothetical protein
VPVLDIITKRVGDAAIPVYVPACVVAGADHVPAAPVAEWYELAMVAAVVLVTKAAGEPPYAIQYMFVATDPTVAQLVPVFVDRFTLSAPPAMTTRPALSPTITYGLTPVAVTKFVHVIPSIDVDTSSKLLTTINLLFV